jgi:hypothetical protein
MQIRTPKLPFLHIGQGRGDAINQFAPSDRATGRRAGAREFTALRLSRPRAAAVDLISTA